MTLARSARSCSLLLGAALLMLAAPAARACDKESHASSASTASSCVGAGKASCATADLAPTPAAHASGCCGMSKTSASAARAASKGVCPYAGTTASAKCPHDASMTTAKGACPHDACTTTKSAATSRTASATRKVTRRAKPAVKRAPGTTAAATTVGTAGVMAVIDPTTGGVARPTAGQLQLLAAGSKSAGMATNSATSQEFEVVRLQDGTLMARVPERFMMNAVAHRDANGKISFSCQQDVTVPAPAGTTVAPAPAQTWETK